MEEEHLHGISTVSTFHNIPGYPVTDHFNQFDVVREEPAGSTGNLSIGTTAYVKDLQEELLSHPDKKLAIFQNNLGSDVRSLIHRIANPLVVAGIHVAVLEKKEYLQVECKHNLRGNSPYFSTVLPAQLMMFGKTHSGVTVL